MSGAVALRCARHRHRGIVSMSFSRVLVTGSSGCLGRGLVDRLVQQGRTVVGLDLKP
jgi:hypothetical protein